MARYLISYTNGSDQIIEADRVDLSGDQYIARGDDRAIVAYIPVDGVFSVVRLDTEVVSS